MSFEDRLRDHLTDQGQTIDITPEGPEAAMTRHGRRARQRMAASAAAIALVFAGGFGLWTLSDQAPEQQTTVTGETETTEADDSEEAGETSTDESGDGSGDATTVSTRLEVVERIDENAPSAAWETEVDGNVYYVLSTAPGSTWDPNEFNEFGYRPDTIYRFDPDTGWASTEITDRWITDFAPSNGVLYVLSTGRADGSVEGAIGVSTDQGATWDWRPVPALDQFSETTDQYGYSSEVLRLITVGERSFVLAQSQGWPDWDEGVALANDAGLELSRQQVMDVNPDGIVYNPELAPGEGAECWAILDRFYQTSSEIWSEFEGEAQSEEEYRAIAEQIEPRIEEAARPFEAELLDAGCVNEIACQRIMSQYYEIGQDLYPAPDFEGEVDGGSGPLPLPNLSPAAWQEIERQVNALREEQAPGFEAELEAAGCENSIKCERISSGVQAQFADEQTALGEFYERYEELSEEERQELHIREQAMWARIHAATEPALIEAGCIDGEGEIGPEATSEMYPPDDFEQVSWDELGVEVPDSWGVSASYFEYVDGDLVQLDSPFESEPVVRSLNGASGVQVITMPRTYGPFNDEPPVGSVWTTQDGVSWTRTGSENNPYSASGPGPYTVGDVSLRIDWGEPAMIESAVDFESQAFPEIPADAEIQTGDDGLPFFLDPDGNPVPIPVPPMPGPPNPTLERSVAGGPWESITVGDLVPDFGDSSVFVDGMVESEAGLAFLVRPQSAFGGPDDGSLHHIIYSPDGVEWNATSMDVDWASGVSVGESLLFIGSHNTPLGESPRPSVTVLLRPAG